MFTIKFEEMLPILMSFGQSTLKISIKNQVGGDSPPSPAQIRLRLPYSLFTVCCCILLMSESNWPNTVCVVLCNNYSMYASLLKL